MSKPNSVSRGSDSKNSSTPRPPKQWTITERDEIRVIAFGSLPHVLPLNPKHVWPIDANRMHLISLRLKPVSTTRRLCVCLVLPSDHFCLICIHRVAFLQVSAKFSGLRLDE
jgi:hypothetical protein